MRLNLADLHFDFGGGGRPVSPVSQEARPIHTPKLHASCTACISPRTAYVTEKIVQQRIVWLTGKAPKHERVKGLGSAMAKFRETECYRHVRVATEREANASGMILCWWVLMSRSPFRCEDEMDVVLIFDGD